MNPRFSECIFSSGSHRMMVHYFTRPSEAGRAPLANSIQDCKECVALLGEYIEGSLPAERAKELEAHLSLCMPCITFVRTYKATRNLCRGALAREMPRELMTALGSFLGKHVPGFSCPQADVAGHPAEEPIAGAAPKKS